MTRYVTRQALLVSLCIAGAALAGDPPPPSHSSSAAELRLVNLFIKGGAGMYTGSFKPYTSVGPTWGVGIAFQPVSFFGVEFAYDGSYNASNPDVVPDPGNRPGLVRNGVSTLLKLSAPLDWFRPFVGVGFGVSWLTPTGSVSPYLQNGFMEELPLAGGIDFWAGPVLLGARFTYRFLFNNTAITDPLKTNMMGGLADVQLVVGVRF